MYIYVNYIVSQNQFEQKIYAPVCLVWVKTHLTFNMLILHTSGYCVFYSRLAVTLPFASLRPVQLYVKPMWQRAKKKIE